MSDAHRRGHAPQTNCASRRTTYAVVWLLCSALVAACATAHSQSQTIVKSPNDTRTYRSIVLDNGMKVLLVSDPKTDKAAAALTVFRGSYDDPKGRAGLAHFLEHMLFLGTAKYPQVEGYQSYITTHGGSYNAYTSSDHTNFFFDIQPQYFQGALDRFAQFFIAPTFDAAYVDREKNAVNSEYQLYLKDDAWRGNFVTKELFNPAHPAVGFNIGSLDTLSGDVRDDLIKFYRTHYSADQMALVVLGSQSLDQLQQWITPMFSAVPKRAITPPTPLPRQAAQYAEQPRRSTWACPGTREPSQSFFGCIPIRREFERGRCHAQITTLRFD